MKRRTKKKILSAILIITILSTCVTPNVFAATSEVSEGGTILKRLYESGKEVQTVPAMPTAEYIKEDEAAARSLYLDDVMEINGEYAKYYGGSYLDNGELVVLLTDTSSVVKSFVKNTIESTPKFKRCDVSLQELEAIKEAIVNYWDNYAEGPNTKKNEMVADIVAVGIYVDQNKVFVGIDDCDEEKRQLFEESIINSEHVIVRNYVNACDNSIQLKAGATISSQGGGDRSIGFRARRLTSDGSYEYGIVTAAHGLGLGQSVFYAGTVIGYVSAKKHVHNGKTDAAFVCVSNSNYICSNVMAESGRVYSLSTQNQAVGVTVFKEGMSTGNTRGKITATNVEARSRQENYEWITTKNLYQTDYYCEVGDSGGLVYKNSNAGDAVVGIHKGGAIDNGSCVGFVVKIENISSDLNVVLY